MHSLSEFKIQHSECESLVLLLDPLVFIIHFIYLRIRSCWANTLSNSFRDALNEYLTKRSAIDVDNIKEAESRILKGVASLLPYNANFETFKKYLYYISLILSFLSNY